MSPSLKTKQTGCLKEEHLAVGAVQEAHWQNVCGPNQGFNPVNRKLKMTVLIGSKVLVPPWSQVIDHA